MRLVIIGAGAVGGVVGGFLARNGQEVAFVARGRHGEVIAADGLTVRTPDGAFVVHVPVAATPGDLGIGPDDVVLLAVKGQDTAGALDGLAGVTGPDTPVVSLQNGVSNEALMAQRFSHVYGVTVIAPTVHLEPGVVEARSGPVPAILDVGRYPDGVDPTAEAVAAAFRAAGMASEARPDIMRWKWSKLLTNLGNAIEVVCGPAARNRPLHDAVRAEGAAVLDVAGIAYASAEEDRARRADLLSAAPAPGVGGSTWQSAMRGTPLETEQLTGEIVRLGERHGVPTPVNAVLLRRVRERPATARGPTDVPYEQILTEAGVPVANSPGLAPGVGP